MGEDLSRQRQPHRFEHDRPVGRVKFQNVLADNMDVRGPQLEFRTLGLERRGVEDGQNRFIGVSGRDAEVIHERIEPDPRDEIRVERQGNAPIQPAQRSGDAEVFEFIVFQETEHFVASLRRLNEFRVGLQMIDQPLRSLLGSQGRAGSCRACFGGNCLGKWPRVFRLLQSERRERVRRDS